MSATAPARPGLRLGIDVGGTKLLAVALRSDGAIVARHRIPTGPDTGPRRLLSLITAAYHALGGEAAITSVGVGFPGLVDRGRGRVQSSIMLSGWEDVPLAARVTEALGLPCVIDNDVNAAALAELRAREGDGRARHSMVFVAVGTGIGGAVTLGGQLWSGAGGFAGELGNLVLDPAEAPWRGGPPGTVNHFAAGAAIEARLGLEPGSLQGRVAQGDPAAIAAVEAGGRALGHGLALVAGVLNPALFVIGGGLARLGPRYLDCVRLGLGERAFAQCARGTAVQASRAGYDAGAIGAAILSESPIPPGAPHGL